MLVDKIEAFASGLYETWKLISEPSLGWAEEGSYR